MEILKKAREQGGFRIWPAAAAVTVGVAIFALGQTPTPAQQAKQPAETQAKDAKAKEAPPAVAPSPAKFYIHEKHAKELQFDCDTCHVPATAGSVVLKRPGHEQCMGCHQEAYDNVDQKYCSICHSAFPPTSSEDLLPYPQFKKDRAILFEFSHVKHVDPKGRINAQNGFRADCTFCHKFEPKGELATFPGHTECTQCHSQGGMKPNLSATSTTADCRGCHNPEEIEHPGFTTERRMIAPHVVSGTFVNLKYNHVAHFKVKDQYNLDCTTCHYAVTTSNSLSDLTLPQMIDCVACHDTSKTIAAEFRMSNCSTCHIDPRGGTAPSSHARNIKPPFHTDNFRQHHEAEASSPGAKCFVCHQNVTPGVAGGVAANLVPSAGASQCVSCLK